jgi:very-short-patch-repair endonuclease
VILSAVNDFWLSKWMAGSGSESAADEIRDRRLAEDGYRVLRFWNNEILGNLEGVLASIQTELSR